MDTFERLARALELKPSQLLDLVEQYDCFALAKQPIRNIEALRNHPLLKLPAE
jgi:hypothetical protein